MLTSSSTSLTVTDTEMWNFNDRYTCTSTYIDSIDDGFSIVQVAWPFFNHLVQCLNVQINTHAALMRILHRLNVCTTLKSWKYNVGPGNNARHCTQSIVCSKPPSIPYSLLPWVHWGLLRRELHWVWVLGRGCREGSPTVNGTLITAAFHKLQSHYMYVLTLIWLALRKERIISSHFGLSLSPSTSGHFL